MELEDESFLIQWRRLQLLEMRKKEFDDLFWLDGSLLGDGSLSFDEGSESEDDGLRDGVHFDFVGVYSGEESGEEFVDERGVVSLRRRGGRRRDPIELRRGFLHPSEDFVEELVVAARLRLKGLDSSRIDGVRSEGGGRWKIEVPKSFDDGACLKQTEVASRSALDLFFLSGGNEAELTLDPLTNSSIALLHHPSHLLHINPTLMHQLLRLQPFLHQRPHDPRHQRILRIRMQRREMNEPSCDVAGSKGVEFVVEEELDPTNEIVDEDGS